MMVQIMQCSTIVLCNVLTRESGFTAFFAGEGERAVIGGIAEVTHFGIVSSSFLRFRHAASWWRKHMGKALPELGTKYDIVFRDRYNLDAALGGCSVAYGGTGGGGQNNVLRVLWHYYFH
jgi:hypothetical protein